MIVAVEICPACPDFHHEVSLLTNVTICRPPYHSSITRNFFFEIETLVRQRKDLGTPESTIAASEPRGETFWLPNYCSCGRILPGAVPDPDGSLAMVTSHSGPALVESDDVLEMASSLSGCTWQKVKHWRIGLAWLTLTCYRWRESEHKRSCLARLTLSGCAWRRKMARRHSCLVASQEFLDLASPNHIFQAGLYQILAVGQQLFEHYTEFELHSFATVV